MIIYIYTVYIDRYIDISINIEIVIVKLYEWCMWRNLYWGWFFQVNQQLMWWNHGGSAGSCWRRSSKHIPPPGGQNVFYSTSSWWSLLVSILETEILLGRWYIICLYISTLPQSVSMVSLLQSAVVCDRTLSSQFSRDTTITISYPFHIDFML